MEQPMNQAPMQPQQPAVSKWLWIVLIIVVVLAGAFFAWYYLMGPGKEVKSSSETTTTTTQETITTTPTSTTTDKTATNKEEVVPSAVNEMGNKTFDGTVESYGTGECGPVVTFEYPQAYSAYQASYSAGKGPLSILKDDHGVDLGATTTAGLCQKYATPMDYYNAMVKDKEKVTTPATETTIAGLPAITYKVQGDSSDETKIIIKSDPELLTISYHDADKDAYDVIINSLKFK